MSEPRTVLTQILSLVPRREFEKLTRAHGAEKRVRSFPCWAQLGCLIYAQLSRQTSLRDLVIALETKRSFLYHCFGTTAVHRTTLADANESRSYKIYESLFIKLYEQCKIQAPEHRFRFRNKLYSFDSSTIDLCLSVFPWARFRQAKAAVKMHTLLDLRGNIPTFIHISDGKMHEVNVLDILIPEAGSFYIMDRGFTDFARWFVMHQAQAFFVIRGKSNLLFRRVYSRTVDKSTGLRCDQSIALIAPKASKDYPQHLRRIKFYDAEHDRHLVFLTNNFDLPALTIAQLYRCRWQVELFFKWIKQHLRIKRFYGTTENAVKTQIWIAIAVYVLVAIVKKRLNTEASLYTILQILSLALFEKMPLDQLVKNSETQVDVCDNDNQMNLFN